MARRPGRDHAADRARGGLRPGSCAARSECLLRATLGIGISLVAIWILLRSVDVGAALEVLRTASPVWIAFMLVAVARRCRGPRRRAGSALLRPIQAIPYRRVLGYTYVGYLANNVLPARLGELVRSHALGEGEGLSRTTVLGTVVVERIVDTRHRGRAGGARRRRAERPGRDVERRAARRGLRRRCSWSAWSSGWPPIGCLAPTG